MGKHVTSKRDQRRFLAADGALSVLLMGHLRRYLVCLWTSVWLNALVYMQCWDHLSIQTHTIKEELEKCENLLCGSSCGSAN